MTAVVFRITAACVGCGACLRTCPERAIRVEQRGLVVLPTCSACGECAEVCPVDACVEVVVAEAATPPRQHREASLREGS